VVKRPERGVNHPAHLAPRLKKREELYISSPVWTFKNYYKAKFTSKYLQAKQIPPELNQHPPGSYKLLFARRRRLEYKCLLETPTSSSRSVFVLALAAMHSLVLIRPEMEG
jgi:hypothetical protein